MSGQTEPQNSFREDLRQQLQDGLKSQRPVLTHLNADTSWLLQLPSPDKGCYRVLIDPWLSGPQHDVAPWFSKQSHSIACCVQTVAELEDVLRSVIKSERAERLRDHDQSEQQGRTSIDAILISHPFSDHCHKATLLDLEPTIPVFAAGRATRLIKNWAHFHNVHQIPSFATRRHSQSAIRGTPPWLSILRIEQKANPLQFHSAIAIMFDVHIEQVEDGISQGKGTEAIIYTAHGLHVRNLRRLCEAKPNVKILALLHGLHDIKMCGTRLNLGAYNGLKVQGLCQATYWIATHDEVKDANGLIKPLLRRKVLNSKDVVTQRSPKQRAVPESQLAQLNCIEVRSAQSVVLH